MKLHYVLIFLHLLPEICSAQFSLQNLKAYVAMSPSQMDEILSQKGFVFSNSVKNDDNDGKTYIWNNRNKTPGTFE